MVVKISANDKGTPPGKLAEAEIHFEDGYLNGLKLVGFAVWERRNGTGRNVTFPARQLLGERRAAELRAAAAGHGHHGAGSRAGSDPAGVRRSTRRSWPSRSSGYSSGRGCSCAFSAARLGGSVHSSR